MPLIAPALLAADFACLGEALGIIEAAGCRMVHLDVGDSHFSRDVTLGQPVVEFDPQGDPARARCPPADRAS